jgi:hypothetical protein
MTGVLALGVCLVCPLVDLFDQWDHTLQTGHDTEYPLVIIALCVGAAILLGRLTVTFFLKPSVSSIRCTIESPVNLVSSSMNATELTLVLESPPLSLRI